MKQLLFIILVIFSILIHAQKSDFSHINFEKSDSIAKSYNHVSLGNMPLLVYQLTKNLNTQVEQFRAIHTWVCLNIESDHAFSEKVLKKRRQLHTDSIAFSNWNAKAQSKVFKKLLEDKKTMCSGYAYIIKAMSSLADIECEIIDGYGRSLRTNFDEIDFPNHSWNSVKLNDKWYLIDATNASGFFNIDENIFVKNYNDGYFLADPELFAKNHYPLDEKWLLSDDSTSLDAFVKGPIVYGQTYNYGFIPVSPNVLVTSIYADENVVFKFKISENHKADVVSLVLSSGLRYKKIIPSQSDYNNGFLELTYHFTKKGHYDVHAMINEDIVVSYTIIVEKPKKSKSQNF